MLSSEERVPVCLKDRLMMVTSAAAMLFAAASVAARAQNQTFDLRGTDAPLPQIQAQMQASGDDSGASDGSANGGAAAGATPGAALGATPAAGLGPGAAASGPAASQSDASDVTNYGRPKPKKPKLYQLPVLQKPKQRGFPPLPPLTVYKTAPGAKKKATKPPPETEAADPPPTVAVIPSLPNPPKPKREENPYDPLGVDVGSLRLFPYAEVDSGYDSNPNRLAGQVVGSSYVHGETGLKLQSQWSQNSLGADLLAGYYDYFSVPAANRPDINGTVTGRVDVTKTTKINLESRFGLTTQQPGSPQLAIPGSVFITSRPSVTTFGQTIGVSQQLNRLTLDLRGSFDRIIFGDATQSDGSELLLSQDNYNAYGLTGRASYELTPGVIPFVQMTGDERRYDGYVDQDGFARNSDGIAAKIGTKFDMTHLLTGEISTGYADRDYVDPRLPHLQAPTLDGSLIYIATPLTTLTLTAATYLSETTVVDASGAVSRRLTAKIAHALLRNLTLTGTASFQVNQYQGVPITEQLYSAGIGAEHSLTRSIVIRGSFTQERLRSNLAGDDYTANVFLVGLKLQR